MSAPESFSIVKPAKSYRRRLLRGLLPNIVIWIILAILLSYIFGFRGQVEWWIIGALMGAFLAIVLWEGIRSAEYQIVKVTLDKEHFIIDYLKKDRPCRLHYTGDRPCEITLNTSVRGFFPFNAKKRVRWLRIRLQNDAINICQYPSTAWPKAALFDLYYDGFERYYFKYWIDNKYLVFKK